MVKNWLRSFQKHFFLRRFSFHWARSHWARGSRRFRLIRAHFRKTAGDFLPPFVTGATEAAERGARRKADGGSSLRDGSGGPLGPTHRSVPASRLANHSALN